MHARRSPFGSDLCNHAVNGVAHVHACRARVKNMLSCFTMRTIVLINALCSTFVLSVECQGFLNETRLSALLNL
jgi:hypothetical protein